MVQSALELLLPLPPEMGLRAGLQATLRDAIHTGVLQAGTRLPSSRALAADLGVSRGTVVDAYDQLATEGWLTIRPASGTVVADVRLPPQPGADRPSLPAAPVPPRHDLRAGRPEAGSFPRAAWLAATRNSVGSAADTVWDYGEPLGLRELREALAGYLGRARGVLTEAEQLLVCDGFTGGLGLIASLLPPAAPVAVEATTLPGLLSVLHRHGHPTQPIPVDDGGAVIDALDQLHPAPAAVLVTPAHQFPYGPTLDPCRRRQLVDWVTRHDALVIEDDYDGEFRYDRQPVGALQSLSPEHVVYGGTASKTLAPALRLGWLAVPPRFSARLAAPSTSSRRCPVPVTDQLAMAELIGNGTYDRHIRRMRRRYRQRRDELVSRLQAEVPNVRVRGTDAGLHAVLQLPADADEAAVLSACADHDVVVGGLHYEDQLAFTDGYPGIILGYATPAAHAFNAAIDALIDVLREELVPQAAS